jgi:DNA mismatch repair ATPase MutS
LATLGGQPRFCRPTIVECPPIKRLGIKVVQGRHPFVEVTHNGGTFIANDLFLGGNIDGSAAFNEASILLLSGPNMVC